ncbi:MAG: alpha-L-arabinofuranosidase [Leptolyngbya sp. PLA3]|nr:MAG: alpha-L-arabinofuranosidase [Cyanobacteria bacterium CYA]MCE7969330.1 alpha-L-arabinofuranosidase [Leptolyngbya sp. PL-A3]
MNRSILVLACALCLAPLSALAQQNLLPDSGFGRDAPEHRLDWSTSTWAGAGTLTRDETIGHPDKPSLSIASDSGADVAWSCTVPVQTFARYRLTGWIRTRGVVCHGSARGALLNVHALAGAETRALTGDNDWTHVAVDFDTGLNDSIMVNCLFGGWGLATGQAWFDDLSLTLLEQRDRPLPHISIDAFKTGEVISPYIYGQFIEHLGRCIYGGIWAEMLEDRKFFHDVDAPSSPWRSFGTQHVVMSDKDPFVGEHSPIIVVDSRHPGGIRQEGLGLVEGARYLGYLWAASSGQVRANVSLRFGEKPDDQAVFPFAALTAQFQRYDFDFVAGASTDNASLAISADGHGEIRIGAVSLMPADNIRGFRADTLALLRRLNAPVYRWPGGNFVSGYDWRDGIGPRDRRPPRKNPAWQGIETNDVGIHEFMLLCGLLDTEPYIAINTGLGSIDSAREQLEYLNGSTATPMGALRAENGQPEPWNVRFIGVGNEMYGDWQLGHIPLADYSRRHNQFVDALRAVDPQIVVIGVGAVGEWSRTMLRDCADRMDHISEHVYWQERPGLLAHVMQAPQSLARTAEAHRQYRRELPNLRGRDIRICEDEWNYWYGPHVFGELGTRYFMKDALGCAAALHEFGRNSDIFFMANYAQTVNVIGAVKTSKTAAAMETTGLVLELYRHHLGVIPCHTETGPTLDALAAWNEDRSALTIGVVNPTTSPQSARLELLGASLSGAGRVWIIASPDPLAHNDPDAGSPVVIEERRIDAVGDTLALEPCSVMLFELEVRAE